MHDHPEETRDHLVALKKYQKRLMRTNLLQVGTSEADFESA